MLQVHDGADQLGAALHGEGLPALLDEGGYSVQTGCLTRGPGGLSVRHVLAVLLLVGEGHVELAAGVDEVELSLQLVVLLFELAVDLHLLGVVPLDVPHDGGVGLVQAGLGGHLGHGGDGHLAAGVLHVELGLSRLHHYIVVGGGGGILLTRELHAALSVEVVHVERGAADEHGAGHPGWVDLHPQVVLVVGADDQLTSAGQAGALLPLQCHLVGVPGGLLLQLLTERHLAAGVGEGGVGDEDHGGGALLADVHGKIGLLTRGIVDDGVGLQLLSAVLVGDLGVHVNVL